MVSSDGPAVGHTGLKSPPQPAFGASLGVCFGLHVDGAQVRRQGSCRRAWLPSSGPAGCGLKDIAPSLLGMGDWAAGIPGR